jgi:hypothetical protein
MRFSVTLLLARAVPCFAASPGRQHALSPDDGERYKVYIIGGQSQAAGKGMTCELVHQTLIKERANALALGDTVWVHYPHVALGSKGLEVLQDALYKEDTTRILNSGKLFHPNASENASQFDRKVDLDGRLTPGWLTLGQVASGRQACTFGPEISFGTRMAAANPGYKITILKVSWPGVDIVSYRKYLYPTLISTLREYKFKYELGGMLWLQGESDAGFIHPDFLSRQTAYPSAQGYRAQLEVMVRRLRSDTGAAVPFFPLTMRIFHASYDAHKNPYNVDVINRAFSEIASRLPSVYVVDGYTPQRRRYFDDPPHCLPQAQCQCLGWLCSRWAGGGCIFQHDLHFTSWGQISAGKAFATALLGATTTTTQRQTHAVNASAHVE